jgi:hypothetical protein
MLKLLTHDGCHSISTHGDAIQRIGDAHGALLLSR